MENNETGERTLEQIEADIERTKEELKSVHGTETEVYARIVGYYRAVRNWNKGKRDEYEMRKLFTLEDSKTKEPVASKTEVNTQSVKTEEPKAEITALEGEDETPVSYELYFREVCPNCPPVKNYLSGISLEGTRIDVDTEEGLEKAASEGVFSTPTAIFRNSAGKEIARAHTVSDLESILNREKVLA